MVTCGQYIRVVDGGTVYKASLWSISYVCTRQNDFIIDTSSQNYLFQLIEHFYNGNLQPLSYGYGLFENITMVTSGQNFGEDFRRATCSQ